MTVDLQTLSLTGPHSWKVLGQSHRKVIHQPLDCSQLLRLTQVHIDGLDRWEIHRMAAKNRTNMGQERECTKYNISCQNTHQSFCAVICCCGEKGHVSVFIKKPLSCTFLSNTKSVNSFGHAWWTIAGKEQTCHSHFWEQRKLPGTAVTKAAGTAE